MQFITFIGKCLVAAAVLYMSAVAAHVLLTVLSNVVRGL